MSKIFEKVEEIPKAERGKRESKYDKIYNALQKLPVGTKGKLSIPRDEVSNTYSALLTRDTMKILELFIRNVEREKTESSSGKEYYKVKEGDLYFEIVEKGTARKGK